MSAPAAAFWRGRSVLVTGHTGFKGGWLAFWLKRLGARVAGLALAPESRRGPFTALGLDGAVESHLVDIRDAAATREAVAAVCPEVVFHLAAQALVRRSYRDPADTFATNVMGTVNVLEAVRAAGTVRVVVSVTSDKCYDNREWPWGYREADALGGHDPYSASKGCAELVSAAWRRSFLDAAGVALATARAGNVIGGGDVAADRLVPDLLAAFAAGRPAVVRNPRAVRPWQHVLDPLAGYLTLAERLAGEAGLAHAAATDPMLPRAFNFGPGPDSEVTVGTVADRLAALWGAGAGWHCPPQEGQPHEAGLLKLDVSQARAVLGWRPRWGLDAALAATVAWHKAEAAGADLAAVAARQIADFEEER